MPAKVKHDEIKAVSKVWRTAFQYHIPLVEVTNGAIKISQLNINVTGITSKIRLPSGKNKAWLKANRIIAVMLPDAKNIEIPKAFQPDAFMVYEFRYERR